MRYYERFRPDAVWVSADCWVSAEAMGVAVTSPGEDQPFTGEGGRLIRSARDIDRLPSPVPASQGRYPLMVEAVGRVVEALGRDAYVVACFDQYPFSLAAELMGIDALMLKLSDDPALVEALMERCLDYGLAYAGALSAAGCDLLSGGDSPAGLIGPKAYQQLAWPFERRLIEAIKAATSKPVSLHICGDASPLLGHMAKSGADVLEIDHQVALSDACRDVGPDITLWGNLDPVRTLAQGRPEDVRRAARHALASVRDRHQHRFVLSSGCTLAVETPFENLEAMLEVDS